MNGTEIQELLSVISGYDLRKVGQSDVDAWVLALQDLRIPNLSLGECVDAVILHYQTSTDRIMPAHILGRVRAERATTLAQVMPHQRSEPKAYERIRELWAPALNGAQARMKDRKAVVLAHPDLAQRLTEEPLNFARADQWNGGIPPEMFNGERNDSPRRTALVELVDEATRRSSEPAA